MKYDVFLGGTCNGSRWRDELIKKLSPTIRYFNPTVGTWTAEDLIHEMEAKNNSLYQLYVITSEMVGVYSIAEAVDSSNKVPERTLFCVIEDGFTFSQLVSLVATKQLLIINGATILGSLNKVAEFLNREIADDT